MLIEPRARNEWKKKKRPITLVWFNYLWELLFSWGFIHTFMMNSICEGCKGQWRCPRDAAVTWGHGGGRKPGGWREWEKVLLVKVTRGTRAEGRERECSWAQGGRRQWRAGRCWAVGGAGKERSRRLHHNWHCRSQVLTLISSTQSLVKILSDLCQILLQIKT